MNKVDILSVNGITKIFLDEKEVEGVTSVKFEQRALELPKFELFMNANQRITCNKAIIKIRNEQQSLEQSARIVREEFLLHEEWYDALVSSIEGYLRGMDKETDLQDVAKSLADRLVGEE